jgi:hypothetical protein
LIEARTISRLIRLTARCRAAGGCPLKDKDMRSAKQQAGVTFIGAILLLIPIAFVAYVAMKAVPAYIESYNVGDVLNSLKKEADLKEKSKDEIYRMIQKRFDINDIHSVGKEDIKIQKTSNEVTISIDYETKVPLFSNAALALSFHKSAVLR